jgi:cytosine/adenosine deaminase-related metal-dependent hydrolase
MIEYTQFSQAGPCNVHMINQPSTLVHVHLDQNQTEVNEGIRHFSMARSLSRYQEEKAISQREKLTQDP